MCGIGGGKLKANSCNIATAKIGNKKYSNMEFSFADLSAFDTPGGFELDGILGFPFLSSGKFSINYKKKKIYLWNDPLEEAEAIRTLTLAEPKP